jgi:hypothetical protein
LHATTSNIAGSITEGSARLRLIPPNLRSSVPTQRAAPTGWQWLQIFAKFIFSPFCEFLSFICTFLRIVF